MARWWARILSAIGEVSDFRTALDRAAAVGAKGGAAPFGAYDGALRRMGLPPHGSLHLQSQPQACSALSKVRVLVTVSYCCDVEARCPFDGSTQPYAVLRATCKPEARSPDRLPCNDRRRLRRSGCFARDFSG